MKPRFWDSLRIIRLWYDDLFVHCLQLHLNYYIHAIEITLAVKPESFAR